MSTRSTYLLGLILIVLLLGTSIYLQLVDGILPCPLCTLQRFTFGILGIFFLIGLFIHKSFVGRCIINSLALIFSLVGIGLTGRQIWLQHFPSEGNGECGVDLQYMLDTFPLKEVLMKVFAGTSECAQRGWEFLHLNMAEWACLWFLFFLVMSIYLLRKGRIG